MITKFVAMLLVTVASAFGPISAHASCKLLVYTPPAPDSSADYQLLSVSAITATDVWAVGYGTLPEVLHFNGSTWSQFPTPFAAGTELAYVKAESDANVWVAGSNSGTSGLGPFISHWNGKSWTNVQIPQTIAGSNFYVVGLLALGPYVWAPIILIQNAPPAAAGILQFDGSVWEFDRAQAPAKNAWIGITGTNLTDMFVSAQSEPPGGGLSVQKWNKNIFAWEPIVAPPQGTGIVASIAARASNDLWLLTNDFSASTTVSTAYTYEHWNGSAWTVGASLPLPAHTLLTQVAVNPTWGYTWFLGNLYIAGLQTQGVVELYDQVRGLMYSAAKSPAIAGYHPIFSSLDPIPSSNEAWIVGVAVSDDHSRRANLAEEYSCVN